MKKRIYFENLDGLRFLCFLSVFLFHSFYTEYTSISTNPIYLFITNKLFANGDIGVNFFFVLSGFLITYLLIEEKKLNKQVSLKKFWMRRILRIWPLFYFCVFFGFIVFPYLKHLFGQVPNETANPLYYLTFTNNFDFIKNQGGVDASNLSILWSVAIEEQFYLLWPIVLFIFPIQRMWIPFITVIGCSLIFRATHDSYFYHEFHTFSCMGDLATGALGAWLIEASESFKKRIENLSKLQIACIYVAFIFVYFFRTKLLLINFELRIFERLLIATIILFILLDQTFSKNSLFKISKFKTISKLGVITYGLYCLHFIAILTTINITKKLGINTELWQVLLIDTPIALLLTIVYSQISYKYFETPFLKLKEKFAFITK